LGGGNSKTSTDTKREVVLDTKKLSGMRMETDAAVFNRGHRHICTVFSVGIGRGARISPGGRVHESWEAAIWDAIMPDEAPSKTSTDTKREVVLDTKKLSGMRMETDRWTLATRSWMMFWNVSLRMSVA
jgi:hypothetical protein